MQTQPAALFRARAAAALAFVIVATVASGAAHAQSCHPAPLRTDPVAGAGPTVVRIGGDFSLRETASRAVRLQAGQSMWFSASGCPRTDDVSLVVTDPDGNVALQRVGHVTGGCVKAAVTGDYRLTVMPVSLRSGYSWGSIAAAGSKSTCQGNE